jgi:hypothetical protein
VRWTLIPSRLAASARDPAPRSSPPQRVRRSAISSRSRTTTATIVATGTIPTRDLIDSATPPKITPPGVLRSVR